MLKSRRILEKNDNLSYSPPPIESKARLGGNDFNGRLIDGDLGVNAAREWLAQLGFESKKTFKKDEDDIVFWSPSSELSARKGHNYNGLEMKADLSYQKTGNIFVELESKAGKKKGVVDAVRLGVDFFGYYLDGIDVIIVSRPEHFLTVSELFRSEASFAKIVGVISSGYMGMITKPEWLLAGLQTLDPQAALFQKLDGKWVALSDWNDVQRPVDLKALEAKPFYNRYSQAS